MMPTEILKDSKKTDKGFCAKREPKGLAQEEQRKQNDKAAESAWPFILQSVTSSSTSTRIDSGVPLK